MNRHTKLAIFIAPFLLVGGYIAADYYSREKEKEKNLFPLKLDNPCNLLVKPCELSHQQLILNISDRQGISTLKSSHPLDQVMFSAVDLNNREYSYTMKKQVNAQHWQISSEVTELLKNNKTLQLRLIVILNKAYYFSEFYSANK